MVNDPVIIPSADSVKHMFQYGFMESGRVLHDPVGFQVNLFSIDALHTRLGNRHPLSSCIHISFLMPITAVSAFRMFVIPSTEFVHLVFQEQGHNPYADVQATPMKGFLKYLVKPFPVESLKNIFLNNILLTVKILKKSCIGLNVGI